VQSAAALKDKGCSISCLVNSQEVRLDFFPLILKDLNRQVVVSEHATISIPELKLELPPSNGRKGYLTTVEGLYMRISDDLARFRDTLSVYAAFHTLISINLGC